MAHPESLLAYIYRYGAEHIVKIQWLGPSALTLAENILLTFGSYPGEDKEVATFLAEKVADGMIALDNMGTIPTFIFKSLDGSIKPLFSEKEIEPTHSKDEPFFYYDFTQHKGVYLYESDLAKQIRLAAGKIRAHTSRRGPGYPDAHLLDSQVTKFLREHFVDAMVNTNYVLRGKTL